MDTKKLEQSMSKTILGSILSADPTENKVEIIREHLESFVKIIRLDERTRCAKDITQFEGDKIEKSTAVMLCMMET